MNKIEALDELAEVKLANRLSERSSLCNVVKELTAGDQLLLDVSDSRLFAIWLHQGGFLLKTVV